MSSSTGTTEITPPSKNSWRLVWKTPGAKNSSIIEPMSSTAESGKYLPIQTLTLQKLRRHSSKRYESSYFPQSIISMDPLLNVPLHRTTHHQQTHPHRQVRNQKNQRNTILSKLWMDRSSRSRRLPRLRSLRLVESDPLHSPQVLQTRHSTKQKLVPGESLGVPLW